MYRFLALTMLLAACGGAEVSAPDMPDDLAAVVADTLALIEEAIPAHRQCLDGLTIAHAWELEDRAEYQAREGRILLRVPATAAHLEYSIVHEVAHHFDITCPDPELRTAFLVAQGETEGTEWFTGESWETTPSEQFATAVAALVTGGADSLRNVKITPGAEAVVAGWAEGVTHQPSAP